MDADEREDALASACFHEAGHALVAHLLDVRIESVSASESGTGKIEVIDIERQNHGDVVRVARAGAYGERVGMGGKRVRLHVDSNDGILAHQAKLRLQRESPKEAARIDEEAQKDIEGMLKEHIDELRFLASRICDRHNTKVPFEELQNALRERTNNGS